jgi:hypothetical protein
MRTVSEEAAARAAAQKEADRADMGLITRFVGTLLAAGWAALLCYAVATSGLSFAGPLLWSLALLIAGMGLGFLFGIPKVLQGTKPRRAVKGEAPGSDQTPAAETPAEGYAQRVNTNLEEISDWLTKIIVGLGLVELRKLPPFMTQLAQRIAGSFGQADAPVSVALAMVVFFPVSGFLYGYLMTRLYLQGALARAERDLTSRLEAVEQQAASASQKSSAALTTLAAQIERARASLSAEVGEGKEAAGKALWDSDPHKGLAGGRAESDDRRLTATIRPVTANSPINRVHLEVLSTDPKRPLTGPVRFLLHPTFDEPDITVDSDPDGVARLDILSWGAFTAGALSDDGATKLELDLARVPGGNESFYAS